MSRHPLSLLTFSTLALAAIGCHHASPPEEPARIATTQQVLERPLMTNSAKPMATTIKQGMLPLAWLAGSEANLTFVDLDTHNTIGSAHVRARQIVSLDAEHGISAGGATLVAGPLNAGHRYAITLVPDNSSFVHQTTISPTRQPRQ